MTTQHIAISSMRSPIAWRGFAAGQHPTIGTVVAGLSLIGWLYGSTSVRAGDLVPFCDGQPYGWPCADTDFNECTRAACNGSGVCDQNANLLIGQPCHDFDDDVCTIAVCESSFPSAYCSQDHPNPDNPPCPDTDGDECSVPQCYQGVCDQSFYVPVGQECGEPDNDVCTFHYCARDYDGNGVCVSASITSCDDNNACTFDLDCHPEFGCQSLEIHCLDGDDNECTTAACDPSSGCETVRRIGEPCQDTDGSPCTVALCGDPCLGGDCGIQAVCDQRAECTNSTPPDISCPPDLRVFCAGAAFSEASGMATATDDCDLNVAIDHEDAETEVNDPPISTLIIDRTWTATNDCELSSQCVQTIEVREPQIQLDIKPGSCPNVIDTRSRGTIRMSILGTPDFDVSAVDVDSLVLFRADDNGSLIAPTSVVLQDTGTPFDGELCGCHRLGGDGIEDLTLKFNNLSVVNALHLNTVPPGATIRLVVYGALTDGCEFTAEDCMFRSGR